MPRANWSAEERRLAKLRAQEWRTFRRNFLYSQRHLAAAMGVARRTVCAVELGEWIPTAATLRKFQLIKRSEEKKELAAAERNGELQAVRAAKYNRYAHIYSADAQGD